MFDQAIREFLKEKEFVAHLMRKLRAPGNNAMFGQAIREFLIATTIAEYAVDGVNSYLAYYNAGVIYECMGNIPEAIKYYSECGNYM